MKRKIVISLLTAAIVLSLGACGKPKNSADSERDKSVHNAVIKTDEGVEGYRMKTNIGKSGKYDDLSKLTGCFTETVDGKLVGYISINDQGATYVSTDTMAPMPLGIESNENGVMIYRANRPQEDNFVTYTFDGKTFKYGNGDDAHEWQKVEYFNIAGNYTYKKMDNSGSENWNFEKDGTGTFIDLSKKDSEGVDFKFKQDKDKLVIEFADGVTDEYKYEYDIISLVLDMDGIVIELRKS